MCKKLLTHNFKLIGQFCFYNDVSELLQSFSELGIRVILETYTWKFPGISDFSNMRQPRCARKIPKPVLKTTLISKETTFGRLDEI
jgi:hypothetical protein